jgi:hypothetical protein
MSSRLIADGVWSIYLTREGCRRVLDGEETDSAKAKQRFHLTIRDEPVSSKIELVSPRGEVVDWSTGAKLGPHSTAIH